MDPTNPFAQFTASSSSTTTSVYPPVGGGEYFVISVLSKCFLGAAFLVFKASLRLVESERFLLCEKKS